MRCMELNKQGFYYALYEGKEPLEEDPGEYKPIYSNPVKAKANISASRGESSSDQFGEIINYDKTMITNKDEFPLTEYSILWVDIVPELNEDGSLAKDEDGEIKTPHDYVIKKIGNSLHTSLIAISKVTVSG